MRLNRKIAFTLIELLVVIAIIAILAATLIPVVTSALDSARIAQMRDTGVGLYKSIFAAEVDDPVFGGNTVSFPSSKDNEGNGWQSSTDYFNGRMDSMSEFSNRNFNSADAEALVNIRI